MPEQYITETEKCQEQRQEYLRKSAVKLQNFDIPALQRRRYVVK